MRNRWLLLCEKHYLKEPARYESILSSMASVQRHRGRTMRGSGCGSTRVSHARPSIIDLAAADSR